MTVEKCVLASPLRPVVVADRPSLSRSLMTQLDAGSASATATPGSPSSAGAVDSSLRRELEELRGQLKEVQRKSDLEIKALTQEVRALSLLLSPLALQQN